MTGEAIAAAAMTRIHFDVASHITVEAVGWSVESEELGTTNGVQGEHNSLITAYGGPARAQWTWSPTGIGIGAIAVFQTVDLPADQAVTGTTITSGSSVTTGHSVAYVLGGQTVYSTARIPYTETLLFENFAGGGGQDIKAVGRNYSQTISGHSGVLTSISLRLFTVNAPTDGVYLELRDSTQNGTLLGTSLVVPASDISSTVTWITFQFPTSQTLNAGTTYWIETVPDSLCCRYGELLYRAFHEQQSLRWR